jgi:Integrase core domain
VPTQFQRALDELNILLICAKSPQAKGRVERMNRSLQDRLVKELRLAGISSIDAANTWCSWFIDDYNRRHERAARNPLDLHTPVGPHEDLARILAKRETRKLSKKLTVKYYDGQYLITDSPAMRALAGQKIAVHTYADGNVELRAGGKVLPCSWLPTAPPAFRPIDVDSKDVHHQVDKLKKKRNRTYRQNRSSVEVASGVIAAKAGAANKPAPAKTG